MANQKIAFFGFNGNLVCFAHALLNVIDMKDKGYDVKLIIEGAAASLIKELNEPGKPFNNLYVKVKELGVLEGICKACAAKMGTLEEAKAQGLNLLEDLSGHPSMSRYIEAGYSVLTL